MLPSERLLAKTHGPRTVAVYKCADCGEVYDYEPKRNGERGLCPNTKCGRSSIYQTRIKD